MKLNINNFFLQMNINFIGTFLKLKMTHSLTQTRGLYYPTLKPQSLKKNVCKGYFIKSNPVISFEDVQLFFFSTKNHIISSLSGSTLLFGAKRDLIFSQNDIQLAKNIIFFNSQFLNDLFVPFVVEDLLVAGVLVAGARVVTSYMRCSLKPLLVYLKQKEKYCTVRLFCS